MLETLFYILAFKVFPELSLLIFLITKDIWDLPFKEKKKITMSVSLRGSTPHLP